MDEDLKYCSLTPDYPKIAYMIFLNPIKGARLLDPYPMAFIYRTLEEVTEVATEATKEIQESAQFTIRQHVLLLPIHFSSLFTLRREFWQDPTHHYDSLDRMKTFQKVANAPQFYKLLVTPTYLDENGKWHLNATLPLYQNADKKIIERFMFHSDQSVDERAKFAAVYTFGTPTRFNWETRQISAIKKRFVHSKHHN